MFAAFPIAACGVIALLMDSLAVFMASFGALIVAIIPFAVVTVLFNK